MTDQDHLDGFLASAGIPAEPTVEATTTDTTTTQTDTLADTGQPRDEAGRFAAKATETQPTEQQQTTQATEAQPPAHQSDRTVPVDVLTAIRGENRELKQQIQQLTTAMQALQRPQATQPPAQQQQQPKEIWDDPDGFVGSKLTPFEEKLAAANAKISHFAAVAEFGKEAVSAAHVAVREAIEKGDLDGNKVNAALARSEDPVGDLVKWHQGQKARENMQRIGGDPDKWLQAELEKRMSDPAFQAQVIERARGNTQPTGQSAQPPLTQLPPSLSKLPGANASGEIDASSEGLFRHAMAIR